MPTYTILGATGSTGSAILAYLLTHPRPNLTLNLYVRSSSKLYRQQPSLSPTPPKHPTINIFEGTLRTPDVLVQALRDADIIFSCIAENYNIPHMTVATDTATGVIGACERLKTEEGGRYEAPTVVVLSSSSTSETLDAAPKLVHWLVETALNYTYADLRRAEGVYFALHEKTKHGKESPLMNVIFTKPGGFVPPIEKGKPTGYELSTEKVSTMVSYADLGIGMVEMGERWEELGLGWKDVSVNATGKVKFDSWDKAKILSNGILANWAPRLWEIGRRRGWW